MHSIHVTMKFFKIRGTQHQLEYTPHLPNKESVHPGSLTGRGTNILIGGDTEVHKCFRGF